MCADPRERARTGMNTQLARRSQVCGAIPPRGGVRAFGARLGHEWGTPAGAVAGRTWRHMSFPPTSAPEVRIYRADDDTAMF